MRNPPKAITISEELAAKCDVANATERFTEAMRKIISVPHGEILRREAEYKKRRALRPNRTGPKKRVSRAPGDRPHA
jgi:hypothetical protein